MINRITTNQALEYSFQELMLNKSFDKIKVSDICDNCGVNRQMFYYYYKDKFDLLNHIYQTNANNIVNNRINTQPWEKVLCGILEYLMKNRKFYINAFNIEGQNSFSEFLFSYTYDLNKRAIRLNAGEKLLGKSDLYSIKFYCHGAVCIAKDWARKDMSDSPEFMAKILTSNLPNYLKGYFK